MNAVFILGAGASRQAGVPLMNEFLDTAWRIHRTGDDSAVRDVFQAISELQGVFAKAYLDLENIESLFGAVEMAQLVNRLGKRSPEEIAALRANLVTLIVQTIERTTHFPVTQGQILPAQPYQQFVAAIRKLQRDAFGLGGLGVSFLTFNYDIALDQALFWSTEPFDYGLSETIPTSAFPLLKLHGSINWGVCKKCQTIVPFNIGEVSARPREVEHFLYLLGSNLGKKSHCGEPLSGPLIVPPTWNKNSYHSGISHVWTHAAQQLAKADSIFIIGYSLPESDAFFRYLFALGTTSDTRLRRLWIINPDESTDFKRRISEMVGRGIQGKMRFLGGEEGLFQNAIVPIRDVLASDLK